MKKTFTMVALAALFASCSKQPEITKTESQANSGSNKTVSALPGQGNSETYLQLQSNGSFSAGYHGVINFSEVIRPTINFVDGQQVYGLTIPNNGEYLSVSTIGPYFVLIRPTFVGSIAPKRAEIDTFRVRYNDYLSRAKKPDSTLKQPYLPLLDDFVTGDASGEIIIKGQVVMSNASPTKMSVVSSSYIPSVPPIINDAFLGYISDTSGNTYHVFNKPANNGPWPETGTISSVKAYTSTGAAFNVLGFTGTWQKAYNANGQMYGYRVNITIYVNSTTTITRNEVVYGM